MTVLTGLALLANWWLTFSGGLADVSTLPLGLQRQTPREAGYATIKSTKVVLCFRNYTNRNLLLCGLDEDGTPHHCYKLEPHEKGVNGDFDSFSERDHFEDTYNGHAFALYAYDHQADMDDTDQLPSSILTNSETLLLGCYRPKHTCAIVDREDKRIPCHLITLEANPYAALTSAGDTDSQKPICLDISSEVVYLDSSPIDTTSKRYRRYFLADWPIYCSSPDWRSLSSDEKRALEEELRALQERMPVHAVRALRWTTPLYINKSFLCGPVYLPRQASGICFHGDEDYLEANGMHREKFKCVELFSMDDFLKQRENCLPGEWLINGYSQAYFHKKLSGSSNDKAKRCYETDKRDKFYESTDDTEQHAMTTALVCKVPAQAEHFAKLSVAFLSGNKDSRSQMKRHDPEGFAMLEETWRNGDSDDSEDQKEE